ncbi:MAG: hypothetical protein HDS10_05725 [Bacteroides sp.]|nr:hypothetical protein [Bacteroides sp.]
MGSLIEKKENRRPGKGYSCGKQKNWKYVENKQISPITPEQLKPQKVNRADYCFPDSSYIVIP